jgi:hypothetical protein
MMKVKISARLCAGVLLMAVLIPAGGHAIGVGAGISSFFAWWSPSFRDSITGHNKIYTMPDWQGVGSSFSMKPSFLLGPTVSVRLPAGFSFSAVFLWNDWYSARSSYRLTGNYIFFHLDITKWDLDMVLNYEVNRYIKIFTGMKYQGYRYSYTFDSVTVGSGAVSRLPFRAYHSGWGPGLGIGLTLPLVGPLYLLANASMLYLYTDFRNSSPAFRNWDYVYNTVGFNGTASLAWLIEPASVTISLGFRYQFLRYYLWRERSGYFLSGGTSIYNFSILHKESYLRNDDHYYGITLSAVYTLDF